MAVKSATRDLRTEDFIAEFWAARTERSTVYEPREDSFLILDALAELDLEGVRVLDLGTGSGIIAAYCARRGAVVTASDIDFQAVQGLKLIVEQMAIQLELVVCDLFSQIPDRFDMVVFNPPYLPSRRTDDQTTDGGKQGTEIIQRFLKEIPQHLTENGIGMLLVSSLNNPQSLAKLHSDLSFEVLRQQSFFFERLYVMKIKQRNTGLGLQKRHIG